MKGVSGFRQERGRKKCSHELAYIQYVSCVLEPALYGDVSHDIVYSNYLCVHIAYFSHPVLTVRRRGYQCTRPHLATCTSTQWMVGPRRRGQLSSGLTWQ